MKIKKIQRLFFASLAVLSFLSFLYLNLHVVPESTSLYGITESAQETSETLMADIDIFQNLIQSVVKGSEIRLSTP